MNYKKPTMVAKSEPKRTFVAGCPAIERRGACGSGTTAAKCELAK